MPPRRLTGLRPQTYEHPLDAQALNALQKTSGLETVIRKCNEWGFERLLRVQLTGSHLRVTPDSVPDVHEKLLAACDILDLPKVPDLYIASGDDLNAFTAGVERPLIVLNAGTVDRLTDDELLFVIAHEVGHIKNWKRMSEFTADRAGLLASQDANVPITAMMKIAGLPQKYHGAINSEDFIAQAREFKALDADKLNWFVKALSTMGQTHPWTVMRASQFLAWVDSGEYAAVVNAEHALPPGIGGAPMLPGAGFCTQCGRGLTPEARFCPGCGVAVSRASASGNLQPS
jgi:Zn-dependent protease with chaperone function